MSHPLDDQDIRALHSLDPDFEIKDDAARIVGNMEIEVTREAQDRLCITIHFPNGQEFIVRTLRAPFLKELGFGEDNEGTETAQTAS
jgi:hypothetical protein